jgi:hypothetical protein
MKKSIIPVLIITVAILNSCSIPHYYYSAVNQNVPLFKDKFEFSGQVAGSAGAENSSLEVQAGYALPAHIALMANYMKGGKNSSTSTYTDYSKGQYFEGALGYYKSFSDMFVFEVYGGYGQGNQKHVFAKNEYNSSTGWKWVPDGDAQLTYSKLFIQPDIGIRKGVIEAAISARLSKVDFTDINFKNTVYHLDELTLLNKFNTSYLLEPAITFRVGGRSVKGEIQAGFSRNLDDLNLQFEKMRVSIGVRVYLAKKRVEK